MSCKCCGEKAKVTCNCQRLVKSLDLEILDYKVNLPINKTLKQLGCFEYFYIGDATGYYTYDPDNNPVRNSYQNIKFEVKFKSTISSFVISDESSKAALKYTTIRQVGNTLYIESPDERLFNSVFLTYKEKNYFYHLSLEGLKAAFDELSVEFPELKDPEISNLSSDLKKIEDLPVFQTASLKSSVESAGGTVGSYRELFRNPNPCNALDRRRHGYASTCLTLKPFSAESTLNFSTFYTGFFVMLKYDDASIITVYPTFYTVANIESLEKYKLEIISRSYDSYCGLPRDGYVHTPNNEVGCPVSR